MDNHPTILFALFDLDAMNRALSIALFLRQRLICKQILSVRFKSNGRYNCGYVRVNFFYKATSGGGVRV
jgi:hypothetical protein